MEVFMANDIAIILALIGFSGALIGALIGGIISHFSNKRKLKKDLEIRACESVITTMNNLSTNIYEAYLNLASIKTHINDYNECIVKGIADAAKIHADTIKEKIHSHDQNKYLVKISFNNFIDAFESKEVILHDLKKIYNHLKHDLITCTSGHFHFTFKEKILSQIENENLVDEDLLDKIRELWEKCETSDVNSLKHITDFKRELQNHYLSDLFKKYNIPKRKPENDKDIILSLDETL